MPYPKPSLSPNFQIRDYASTLPLVEQTKPASSGMLQTVGRHIKDLTYRVAKSIGPIAKVSFVALLVLGIVCLPAVSMAMTPAVAVPLRCNGDRCYQVTKFPEYTARFMNNGMQLVSNGTAACEISHSLESELACQKLVNATQDEVLLAIARESGNCNGKGFPSVANDNGKRKNIYICIDSEKYVNYKAALEYVEKNVIAKALPFQGTPQETCAFIQDIHRLLMHRHHLPNADSPGEFRTHWLYIDGEGRTSDPKNIPDLLCTFAKQLQKEMQDCQDFVKLAGWVHTEFLRIRPFPDGNCRIARILMNAVLVRGGMNAVIFKNDRRYSELVDTSVKNPSDRSFTNYLRNLAIPWTNAQMPTLTATYDRSTTGL